MKILTGVATFAATALLLTGCSAPAQTTTESQVASPSATATTEASAAPMVTTAPKAPVVDKGIATADATEEQLVYLIEEEKLAHDVYAAMFDLWGSRVFGNILNSEETHQSQVLAVMATRDIDDPRSSKAGVFVNKELQDLYDELIAKGSKSAVYAY